MIPPPLPLAVLALALSVLVTLFLAYRSRAVPALRGAAVTCAVFVGLDVARWVGLPGVVDVVCFVVMPGCWGSLLTEPPAGIPPASPAYGRTGSERILPRLAPPLACLLYAILLLAARHAVAAHWQACLEAPRLVVGAAALLVVMRGRARKDEGPGASSPSPSRRGQLGGVEKASAGFGKDPVVARSPARRAQPTAAPAQPSRVIGASMGLAAGLAAVWGLWSSWPHVQVASALAWVVAGVVAWRAR